MVGQLGMALEDGGGGHRDGNRRQRRCLSRAAGGYHKAKAVSHVSSETARMSAPWLASSLSTALALRSRATPVQYTVCTTHLSKTLPDKIHIQSTCTKHMHKAHVQNTHAKHTQAQSMWGGRPRGRRKGRTWRRGRAGRSTNRWSGRRRGTCPQPTESAVALDRLCRLRSQDDISCPTGSVLRSVQKLAGCSSSRI